MRQTWLSSFYKWRSGAHTKNVVSPRDLRIMIIGLGAVQPIVQEFEAAILERATRKKDRWHNNQKEHWLCWLSEYDGPGFYGRKSWKVSAKNVYNRAVNPSMVLWLGEASGVPTDRVKAAAVAALNAPERMESQSAAIRRIVAWSDIEQAIARNSTDRPA
jgi:hypothetical protein